MNKDQTIDQKKAAAAQEFLHLTGYAANEIAKEYALHALFVLGIMLIFLAGYVIGKHQLAPRDRKEEEETPPPEREAKKE